MTPHRRIYLATAVLVTLTGCATIDFDYPRVESTTMVDTKDTHLGSVVRQLSASKPADQSGFYALQDGIDALTARLLLAERAERTIDTQYYLIKTDETSSAFIDALLKAADRGVRVRLLLDDVFTQGYDAGMAALDSHPNFEIRIFNPFHRGAAGRTWSGLTDLSRVARRMHAKSFTVDGQITILGGRNIADEYFGAHEDIKFGDLDVVGIGPISKQVSTMFDSYWNHETALPVPAFASMPDDPGSQLLSVREKLAQARERVKDTKYAGAVISTAMDFMNSDSDLFEWAPYQLVFDSPDKGIKSADSPTVDITQPLAEALQSAESEVIVLTPYFVPRKSGIEFFSQLQSRGVKVTIVTNSLAANNHAPVHGGYAPSRKLLLRNGVRIYEARPDASVPGAHLVAAEDATTTLHTKAFIVDRKKVFIGSFNFDPRSVKYNTESGVIIESELLSQYFGGLIDSELKMQAYELFLNDDGRLRWRSFENGEARIYKKEPEASLKQRFIAALFRLLPVKGQL